VDIEKAKEWTAYLTGAAGLAAAAAQKYLAPWLAARAEARKTTMAAAEARETRAEADARALLLGQLDDLRARLAAAETKAADLEAWRVRRLEAEAEALRTWRDRLEAAAAKPTTPPATGPKTL